MLVGPLAGGVLVDAGGWEWIFLVNVPIGIIGFVLGSNFIPHLPSTSHRFDIVGVLLSALGLSMLIIAGIIVLIAFVLWQRFTITEPLVPLTLFRDRNFSLGNLAFACVGVSVTTVGFPLMLYAQNVRDFSPTQAALLMVPQAILFGALAPVAGILVDRMRPRILAPIGLFTAALSLAWLALTLTPTTPVWELVSALALFGLANAFLWSPLSVTAIRRLPLPSAGAGSGVYNTTRQMGSVLGSAVLAALLSWRLALAAPGLSTSSAVIPAEYAHGYTQAMAESFALPIIGFLAAGVIALFFAGHPRDAQKPIG